MSTTAATTTNEDGFEQIDSESAASVPVAVAVAVATESTFAAIAAYGDTTGGGDDDLTTDAYSIIDYIDEGATRIHRSASEFPQVIALPSMTNDDDIPRNVVVVTDDGKVLPSTSTSRNIESKEASGDENHSNNLKNKDDESIISFGTGTSQTTVSSSVIHKFERLKTTAVEGNKKDDDDYEDAATVAEMTKKIAAKSDADPNKDHYHRNGDTWSMVERQHQQHRSTRVRNNNWDDDSVSTWNTSATSVGGSYHGGSYNNITGTIADSSSVANSSTISGFDIISLNGTSSHLACRRCTFLNRSLDVFCTVCGIPLLGPNPCMDVDAILAQQLQESENQLAYEITQRDELKRRHMFVNEPLLVQSQIFTKDISQFFDEVGCDTVGYRLLPDHSMMILASRFIEAMIALHRNGKAADVLIRYCVSPQWDGSMLYETIQQNGFPVNSKFSVWSTLDLQTRHCDPLLRNTMTKKQRTSYTCLTATPKATTTLGVIPEDDDDENSTTGTALLAIPENDVKSTTALSVIPEDDAVVKPMASSSSKQFDDTLGWIAAIVKSDATIDVWSDNDTKCVTHVSNPCQTVPLISFDSALANEEVTNRIFQGLIRVCNDYFDAMQE